MLKKSTLILVRTGFGGTGQYGLWFADIDATKKGRYCRYR